MAVENKWVSSLVEAGKKENPAKVFGGKALVLAGTFEVAAADDDGSIYRLAKLPANAIVTKIELNNDAIADATDYDLGLYKENGVVASADVFAGPLDMSAAAANGAEKNGLANVLIENLGKKVWELLGLSLETKEEAYNLALTANLVGTADGTISYRVYYILG
jgi:hypothetical protein